MDHGSKSVDIISYHHLTLNMSSLSFDIVEKLPLTEIQSLFNWGHLPWMKAEPRNNNRIILTIFLKGIKELKILSLPLCHHCLIIIVTLLRFNQAPWIFLSLSLFFYFRELNLIPSSSLLLFLPLCGCRRHCVNNFHNTPVIKRHSVQSGSEMLKWSESRVWVQDLLLGPI